MRTQVIIKRLSFAENCKMSKSYLFAIISAFCFFSQNGTAQNYKSIFDSIPENTTWDIILYGYCDAVCSDSFDIIGDSIINAETYQELAGLGFLREDTVAGKTWMFDPNWNEEYLIMDLSLTVGDTFYLYDYWNNPVVTTVDSVQLINGLKHIWLHQEGNICGFFYPLEFVEGSGPNVGFNYQRWLPINSFMLCQHKNGVKTLGNTLFFDACYVCVGGLKETNIERIQLFPSPANDVLNVLFAGELQQAALCVFDQFGRIQLEIPNWNNQQQVVSISSLKPGIYFVSIKDKELESVKRFVKQ